MRDRLVHAQACIRAFSTAAVLLALVGSPPALAADQPLVSKAPAITGVNGWNGFYVGGHAGYGWSRKKLIDNFPTPDGELDADVIARGGVFGLQAGYNHRFKWLVLGIEGDFSWSDVKRNNFSCFTFGDQVCSAKAEWFGTIAGRIGVTNGPSLIYLKGGPAWVRDNFTDLATCAGTQPTRRAGITAACGDAFFSNNTRLGWLIGGGIEVLLARNWSVKIEYNYMDFGARSVSFRDGGTGFFTEEIHQKANLVKAGINYHFDWGPATARSVSAGIFSGLSSAKADDGETSRVLTFSGVDISKYNYGALVGALIAPFKDLDATGLRVFVLGGGGVYKYAGDTGFIRGAYSNGDLLAGYAFEGNNYSVNLLAGVNAINHMLSAIDTENRVQGTAIGAKVRADAWVNPTPQTMAYGEAEYSTAFKTYFSKAKIGYDISQGKQVFFGPEVTALGDERFNQWRVGAHLTQMKLGKLQIDIAAGYARDNIVGAGAYTTMEFSRNF